MKMNRVQLVRGVKPKKDSSKRERSKPEWNNRFIVEKIPEYSKIKEQVSILKLYRTNLTPSDKKAFKPQEECELDNTPSIDPDITALWNELGVTVEFRGKFLHKLSYFNELFHHPFFECEKKSLKQISFYLSKIHSELSLRDKSLACLRDASASILRESHPKVTAEVKNALLNIKASMSNIVSYLKKLRKKTQFGIVKGKYCLEKMKHGYILDSQFVVQLNNDLQFIREGTIGRLFNLKGDFDPLLINLEDKGDGMKFDKKILIENSYCLFTEMIYNNLIFAKSLARLSASTVQLKVLTKTASRMRTSGTPLTNNISSLNYSVYNNNDKPKDEITRNKYKEKEDLKARTNDRETIDCISKESNGKRRIAKHSLSPQGQHSNEDIIDLNEAQARSIVNYKEKTINLVKHKDAQGQTVKRSKSNCDLYMCFYTGNGDAFVNVYEEYTKAISMKQRRLFNIQDDIQRYFTEGVNQLIVTHYNNSSKTELVSLCILSSDPLSSGSLVIQHLSTVFEADLEYVITQLIAFLQNSIPYKELAIHLYYETSNKPELPEDTTQVFLNMNFQWMKMENSKEKQQYQTIKCLNSSEIQTKSMGSNRFEVKSGTLALAIKQPINSDKLIGDYNKISVLNTQMISALMSKSSKIQEMKEAFSFVDVFEGKEEKAIEVLQSHGFSKAEFIPTEVESEPVMSLSCFRLLLSLRSLFTKKINYHIYNRIIATNSTLQDKDTKQMLYQIPQADYMILIGTMTDQLSQRLSKDSNLYAVFALIFSKMRIVQESKSYVLWIPSFSITDRILCMHPQHPKLALSSYTTASFPYCPYYTKTLSIEPQSEDIVLSDSFILAVISLSNNPSMSNQLIYCSIVDKAAWSCSD